MSYAGTFSVSSRSVTDTEFFKACIRCFTEIHKKYRFQNDKPSPFAEVFDKLDEFVTANPANFPSRFTSCPLTIGQSDAGQIMAIFPAKVAEFLDLGKRS
jgi:hypothetical protein